ncbi:SMI1/KNR4 family protein, partial [Anaerosporobacter sp.]
QYEEKGDFTYPNVNDIEIIEAEKKLNVKMPEQYCWFLKKYGHGGIGGIETYGIGKNGKMIFVDKTIQFKSYGLADDKIVIENCDEWIYCLDEKTETVEMWSQGDKNYKTVYEDFLEYLRDRMSDAIENM